MTTKVNVNWYVEIVDGRDGKIETSMGPMSEQKADRVARGAEINLNHETHYVRQYSEDNPPDPPFMPIVGTKLTFDEFALLISGDRPRKMFDANKAFLICTHKVLKDGGVWGWTSTETFWEKIEGGFRRVA